MENVQEKILDIRVRYDDAIRKISDYRSQLDVVRKVEKTLKEDLDAGRISRDKYNLKLSETKVAEKEYTESIRTLNKEVSNNRKVEKEQEDSLVSLRAKLSVLTAEYDKLSKAERNSDEGKKKAADIKALSNELKGAEEETGRFYRNVGNYTESIMKATEANVPFISEIRNSITALSSFGKYIVNIKTELSGVIFQYKQGAASANALSGAQKAAAITSNLLSTALKILKVALVSTGIAAIVLLLGSFVAWLTKTQKGTEFLSNVMSSFGAVVNVLIDRVAKFGGALAKLFSGDFSGAWKDMKESASGVGKEMANDAKQAWALNDAMQQLEKSETMLQMKRAAGRSEIEKLKLVADDTTKSLKERTDAAQKAYDLENKLQKESIDIGKKKLANLLGQTELTDDANKMLEQMATGAISADEAISKLGISESTVKDLKEFSQVFTDVSRQERESYTRNKEVQNKIQTMRKQASEQAKALRDKEIAEVRKAEDEMLKLVKDGREKQTKEINYQYDRQVKDLERRLNTETDLTPKARKAISAQIVSIEQQKKDALAKLSDEQLAKEIADRQKLIETQLASVKTGSEQEYQLKMQRLITQRDAELSQKELTEQMKLAIIQKYNKQIDDLSAKHDDDILKKQQDAIKTRFEMEIEQAHGNEEEVLRVKMEQKLTELNTMQQLEGESIDAFNLRKLKVQNEYNDSKQALAEKEIDIEQSKLQSMSEITGGLISLTEAIGESDKSMAMASKVLALAQIAINSGVAVAEGIKAAAGKPFPLNLAAIATTVATILSNIATAVKTVKSAKFAQGGEVTGPGTSTSDSIPAMLSNGESVLTAAATSMFSPLLSSFNMMGGGVPININTTSSSNQTIGEDMLARAVAKGMMMAPPPVVSVEEYTSVANRVKYLEELGNV